MQPHDRRAMPYAKAVFEIARERGQVEAIGRELEMVSAQIKAEPSLRDFFARPWVTPAAKGGAAIEIATRLGLSQLTRDLVALVAARGRAAHLTAIADAYGALVDRDLGRVRVRVRTAVALTADERAMLASRLQRALGGNQVILDEAIDRSLLGGFVAESGSYLVDASLEEQLRQMRQRLEHG